MMKGWIKLHRELLDNVLWKCSSPEQKSILITILLLANHDETNWIFRGMKYTCKPGEFITSTKSLAEKAGKGVSVQNVRTALDKFEKLGFLTKESSAQNTLIRIVNWAIYQKNE